VAWRPRPNNPESQLSAPFPRTVDPACIGSSISAGCATGLTRRPSTVDAGEESGARLVDKLALELLYRASRRAAADWFAGERETDIGDSANTAESCVCGICLAEGTRHDLVNARDVVDDMLIRLGLDDDDDELMTPKLGAYWRSGSKSLAHRSN
jgi:hypothetical protein